MSRPKTPLCTHACRVRAVRVVRSMNVCGPTDVPTLVSHSCTRFASSALSGRSPWSTVSASTLTPLSLAQLLAGGKTGEE